MTRHFLMFSHDFLRKCLVAKHSEVRISRFFSLSVSLENLNLIFVYTKENEKNREKIKPVTRFSTREEKKNANHNHYRAIFTRAISAKFLFTKRII